MEATGQVIAAYGKHFLVEREDGSSLPCVSKGKKTGIACGDRVRIVLHHGQGRIQDILPRTSLLYRSDIYREKIIAANVTQVVIVVAALPTPYEEFLNRCLIAAEDAGIRALIALNKCDLEAETAPLLRWLVDYETIGYPLIPVSALGDVARLRQRLQGETSVLVGQSGMGKSSLINALIPDMAVRTAEVSAALDSGKHTTTHAQLYHLDSDSHLIDSPGLQEFGLLHVDIHHLADYFPEFRPHLGQCRFSNCLHLSEPGCAVAAAQEAGAILPRRLAGYRHILQQIRSRQEQQAP
jgi:ribosome biogenesis GTPase